MGTDQSSLNNEQLNQNNQIGNLEQIDTVKNGILGDYNWIPSFNSLNPNKINQNTNTTNISNIEEENKQTYIDLRRDMPSIPDNNRAYMQVVKAVVIIINYKLLKSKKLHTFPPSYLYLSYLLRNVIGSYQLHSFTNIAYIIKQFGICSENDYQCYPERPLDETFHIANPYRHIHFNNISLDINIIKDYLTKDQVLLVGIPIYSNFLKTETNPKLSLSDNDDILLGGFCGLIVGYQNTDDHFIIQTSKGKRWGNRGYIFVPYKQLLDHGAEIIDIEIKEELVLLDMERYQNTQTIPENNLEAKHNKEITNNNEGINDYMRVF